MRHAVRGVQQSPRRANASVELRGKYRQHVARVLALGGMPEQATLAAADDVIAFETRLANTPAAEFDTALAQIHRIARFRLEDLV